MVVEVLDLFSAAAGGWSLGLHRAGFTTIAACEVEAWRRALYAENNPHVRLYDDVRTLTADRLLADLGRLPIIVVGSPPCQDISSANTKGKGVLGARSGLYFEAIRIIGEVRPRWFALENSANLRTRGADAVIAALEALGYACWPLVVRAGDVGANHERPRCWLVGCDLAQIDDAGESPFREVGGFHGGAGALDPGSAAADMPGIGRAPWTGSEMGAGRADRGHQPADLVGDAAQDGCGQGIQGRRAGAAERLSLASCGDTADAAGAGEVGEGLDAHAARVGSSWQLGRHERRQAEEQQRSDGASRREMGLCPADRGDSDRSGPDWTLEHLADHLRLDDGLSAWLAGTRVQIGDDKGQSAASLAVEAFGDAVIPQIPEAIGGAILRTERALAIVDGRAAA